MYQGERAASFYTESRKIARCTSEKSMRNIQIPFSITSAKIYYITINIFCFIYYYVLCIIYYLIHTILCIIYYLICTILSIIYYSYNIYYYLHYLLFIIIYYYLHYLLFIIIYYYLQYSS